MLTKIKKVLVEKYAIAYILLMIEETFYPKLLNIFSFYKLEIFANNDTWLKLKLICRVENVEEVFYNDKKVDIIKNENQSYIFIKIPNEDGELKINKKIIKLTKQDSKPLSEDSIILIMDRVIKADDNGEHLYRFLNECYPNFKNVYFSISEMASDYRRLLEDGFKVIPYDTKAFKKIYRNADVVISSNNTWDIENYHAMRYKRKKTNSKFIFLQHGVTDHMLLDYFSRFRLNNFVVASPFEYDHVSNNFYFFEDEIILSGFPRNDYRYSDKIKKEILFVPTWDFSTKFSKKERFLESDFYKRLVDVLSSKNIINTLNEYNYTLKFILHPEIADYKCHFLKFEKENIFVFSPTEVNYAKLISESEIMITDFSSIFYDFIWLQKTVIFYQTFAHYYDRIVDYDELGFKCTNLEEVENTLKMVISDGIRKNVDDKYMAVNNGHSSEALVKELFQGVQ